MCFELQQCDLQAGLPPHVGAGAASPYIRSSETPLHSWGPESMYDKKGVPG